MRTKKPCTTMLALGALSVPLGSGALSAGASEAQAPAGVVADRKFIREPHEGRYSDPHRAETTEVRP